MRFVGCRSLVEVVVLWSVVSGISCSGRLCIVVGYSVVECSEISSREVWRNAAQWGVLYCSEVYIGVEVCNRVQWRN